MSAGSANGIGPVSVRYAAQIRELLYTQAVLRAAAEQEAARQQDAAEKAARLQPAVDETLAVKIDIEPKSPAKLASSSEPTSSEPHSAPVPSEEGASRLATAQLVNVQV